MGKKISLLHLLELRYPDQYQKELYARILCGEVAVDGEIVREPKRQVARDTVVAFDSEKYVSRGGIKLEAALRRWSIDVKGEVVLDVGASTGGFTDCLLKRGAVLVHAVDSGKNQIAYKLRQDSRVRVFEKTNIMSLTTLDPPPSLAVIDLSFRSLRRAASHTLAMTSSGTAIALAKAQFEWQNPPPSFHGVVERDEDLKTLLVGLLGDLVREEIYIEQIMESPIRGRKGNREFLLLLRSKNDGASYSAVRDQLHLLLGHESG